MLEITPEEKRAYAEVEYIIKNMEEDYASKVPDYIMEFFKRAKDQEYNIKIDNNIPLYMNDLEEYTLDVLNVINLNYWTDNKNEEKQLKQMLENSAYKYKLEAVFDNLDVDYDQSKSEAENEAAVNIENIKNMISEKMKKTKEEKRLEEEESRKESESTKKENSMKSLLFKNLRKLFKK